MERIEASGRTSGRAAGAVTLLRRLVALRWFAPDAIARALVIREEMLHAYSSGSEPMPLDRQLCLAAFVIECVPPLARLGHQLRGQVGAALAFHEHVTETHAQPPASNRL